MNEAQRLVTSQSMEDDLSRKWESVSIGKQDLKAAVDAMDDFFAANAPAINNALPAAAKAGLTIKQKARLLMFVISKRYEVDHG